jgi:hypothetical protein
VTSHIDVLIWPTLSGSLVHLLRMPFRPSMPEVLLWAILTAMLLKRALHVSSRKPSGAAA